MTAQLQLVSGSAKRYRLSNTKSTSTVSTVHSTPKTAVQSILGGGKTAADQTTAMLSFRAPMSHQHTSFLLRRCPRSNLHRGSVNAANLAFREDEKEEIVLLPGDPMESKQLPDGLRREMMPRHVAVIMDGNARWARRRGLPASSGHEAGVRSLRELIGNCCNWGIRVLTVFAFSSDNWTRPKMEVDFLMSLFGTVIKRELQKLMRKGVRISTIGDLSRLPKSLQKLLTDVEKTTKENSKLHLVLAVSYSGKYDIAQACKSIAHKVKDGLIGLEDIDEGLIEQELETDCSDFPHPDLLIRTSGELRLSNFFLWQLAYTELFFSQALWPDFGEAEFVEALSSFHQRQRRYGTRDP